MGEVLIWRQTFKSALICAICFFSSAFSWPILSSIQESASSGKVSQSLLSESGEASPEPPLILPEGGKSVRSNWSLQGWKKGPVTLKDAFGIKKGTIVYPKFQPVLPSAVATSQQVGSKTSGASGGSSPGPSGGTAQQNAAIGKKMVDAAGWGSQWAAFNNIVMAESGWSTDATNSSSGAYGIPQALPGSKMASAGSNWKTSASTQIAWMISYIRSRYGSPNAAWAFHQANGWY